jgi:hypothetical protein
MSNPTERWKPYYLPGIKFVRHWNQGKVNRKVPHWAVKQYAHIPTGTLPPEAAVAAACETVIGMLMVQRVDPTTQHGAGFLIVGQTTLAVGYWLGEPQQLTFAAFDLKEPQEADGPWGLNPREPLAHELSLQRFESEAWEAEVTSRNVTTLQPFDRLLAWDQVIPAHETITE